MYIPREQLLAYDMMISVMQGHQNNQLSAQQRVNNRKKDS
jgi:hypothetical protein